VTSIESLAVGYHQKRQTLNKIFEIISQP